MKANATVQCPIEKGSYVIEQTVTLPKEIPAGAFIEYLREQFRSFPHSNIHY